MDKKNDTFYREVLYVLFLFFVSSLIGGLLESGYVWLLFGKFHIGGFMYGPWRPIYGFGCLLLYFITKKITRGNFFIFFNCMMLCSLFEYLSSFVLEMIFHRTWWSYHHNFLNINGRICLLNSLLWGVLGLIFLNWIEPFTRKIFDKFEIKKMAIFLLTLFFLYQVDGLFSWLKNIR